MREAIKSAQRFASGDAWKDYIIGPFGDFANATDDAGIDRYIRGNAATFFHPVGTAQMSAKGASYGVTDPNLKVKGVHGLRIVDASVMVCPAFRCFDLDTDCSIVAIHHKWTHTGPRLPRG